MSMYFLLGLSLICALEGQSPRMGQIDCYIIGSISALINQNITFWAIEVHICTLVLTIPQCHISREHTGQMMRETKGLGHPADVSEVRKWFEVGLKVNS